MGAMLEYVDEYARLFLRNRKSFRCRSGNILKAILRNQRNDIIHDGPRFAHGGRHIFDVLVVNARAKNRIHFDKRSTLCHLTNAFELVVNQNFCGFYARIGFTVVENSCIDHRLDFRVHGIHRNRERINAHIDNFVCLVIQQESVSTHAANQLREFLFYQAECI